MVPRQDMCRLVRRLNLPNDEIILDLGAGDGAQVKQLRANGYPHALGVDLVGNPPFVQCGDLRDFARQDFDKSISLVSFRYSLHLLDPESIRKVFFDVCTMLRKRSYVYIVAFDKNDPVISTGHTINELIDFMPKEMRVIEISQEPQEDKCPYPHRHSIIRALFRKEEEEDD